MHFILSILLWGKAAEKINNLLAPSHPMRRFGAVVSVAVSTAGKKIGRFIKTFWVVFNLMACVVFILSCVAPYVNPGKSAIIAFFGLGLPVIFVLLGLLLLVGLFVNRRVAMLPLFCLVLGSYNSHNYVPIFPQAHIASSHCENISVMSWNVMNFDLLNNKHTSTVKLDAIIALIAQEQPDVLMLQEFYSGEGEYNTRAVLKELYPYDYFESPVRHYDGTKMWGQAIFSKYPIVNKSRINFANAETNKAMVADIDVCGQIVRVFNLHMQSIHFQADDYAAIEKVKGGSIASFPFGNLVEKIKLGFEKRGEQSDKVAAQINSSTYPVIVAGDFNDTPNSYTYSTLSSGLQDAFWHSGEAFGSTYNGPIPGLRIDHMLADRYIKINSFRIVKEDIGDHFPIISNVGIPLD